MWLRIFLLFALLSLGTALALRACFKEHDAFIRQEKEIGAKVDSLHGVYVYYNGMVSHVDGRNLSADGYNLGLKYQCVEFVKRYYYEHYDHKMPDTYGHAKSFFKTGLTDGALNKERNLYQYTNGSTTVPKVGDLLVFDGTIWNEYGHVAIISEVGEEDIEIIQQNPGPSADSRIRIALEKSDGLWKIDRTDALGWLRKTD